MFDHGLWLLQVPEHAMAQDTIKALTAQRLIRLLAVGLHESHPTLRLSREQPQALSALSNIAGDGSSTVTS